MRLDIEAMQQHPLREEFPLLEKRIRNEIANVAKLRNVLVAVVGKETKKPKGERKVEYKTTSKVKFY